jgi:hypothetical protein
MRRLLEYGGHAAAVVLVAFGVGALVLSINGKGTVKDSLGDEKIVGTADMTPDGIAAEAQKAGLGEVDLPSCSVAGERSTQVAKPAASPATCGSTRLKRTRPER